MNFGRYFISRNPWVVPAISAVHRFLYRVSGGRIGGRAGATMMLLLTTRGRHSGKERSTPLLYIEDAGRFIVVASNGGTEKVPGWWFNLQADPKAIVQAGRQRHVVCARQADDGETRQLWPRLMASYEFFDDYQDRTQREIPVVILQPEPNEREGLPVG